MGPYQRTPKEVARAIRFSGLGVPSVGPVGDFLERIPIKQPGFPTESHMFSSLTSHTVVPPRFAKRCCLGGLPMSLVLTLKRYRQEIYFDLKVKLICTKSDKFIV